MKKLLLTICTSLFCVLSYAQTEHLTFKGLPIDGNKQEFVKELKRCEYIVELGSDDCLSGEFVGRACLVIIHSTPRTDIVCGVTVIFEQVYDAWSQIKSAYENLVWFYSKKYGDPILDKKEFTGTWKDGDGHELFALKHDQCIYKTDFSYIKDDVLIGYVMIEMTNTCRIVINYYDTANVALMRKEQVQDI